MGEDECWREGPPVGIHWELEGRWCLEGREREGERREGEGEKGRREGARKGGMQEEEGKSVINSYYLQTTCIHYQPAGPPAESSAVFDN